MQLAVLSFLATVTTEHIEITPGICGGKPRIAGHRIKVQNVVIWHERMGLSPDEILLHYPTITLSDVYAALAYYHDHRDEIQRQIQEGEEFASSNFVAKSYRPKRSCNRRLKEFISACLAAESD